MGVKTQILNGYLVWAILVVLAIGFNVALRWLPAKAEASSRNRRMKLSGRAILSSLQYIFRGLKDLEIHIESVYRGAVAYDRAQTGESMLSLTSSRLWLSNIVSACVPNIS